MNESSREQSEIRKKTGTDYIEKTYVIRLIPLFV